jgi:hypothetical protein
MSCRQPLGNNDRPDNVIRLFLVGLALRGTASSVVAKAVVTCGILASRAENTYDTAINIQLGR